MVKLAIVGCGGMAQGHAKTFAGMNEVRLTAFCDVDLSRAVAYQSRYAKQARTFASFDDMLVQMRGDLDGVVLVTPHTLHYPHAKAALEAGLHVLTEKPMVTQSEHAYDLWQTVNRTGKQFAIAFQASYSAAYQAIKALRDSGGLGKVQLVNGWLAQSWMTSQAGTWRQDPSLSGGGQMYDSGAHLLNAIMWILNEPVVEVSCMYDTCGTPVDINGVVIMKFQSGAMGTVAIGGNCPGWDVDLRIQTDTLFLKTCPHGGSLKIHRDGKPFDPVILTDDTPGAFTPQRNFVNAILGTETLQVPVRYGVLLSALMDAMYESARLKKLVSVKPVPSEL
jgi:predicted dehydrogenase